MSSQVDNLGKGYRYQGAEIHIYHHQGHGEPDHIEVFCQEKELKIKVLKQEPQGPLMGDRKEIDRFFDQKILQNQDGPVLPTGFTAQCSPYAL